MKHALTAIAAASLFSACEPSVQLGQYTAVPTTTPSPEKVVVVAPTPRPAYTIAKSSFSKSVEAVMQLSPLPLCPVVSTPIVKEGVTESVCLDSIELTPEETQLVRSKLKDIVFELINGYVQASHKYHFPSGLDPTGDALIAKRQEEMGQTVKPLIDELRKTNTSLQKLKHLSVLAFTTENLLDLFEIVAFRAGYSLQVDNIVVNTKDLLRDHVRYLTQHESIVPESLLEESQYYAGLTKAPHIFSSVTGLHDIVYLQAPDFFRETERAPETYSQYNRIGGFLDFSSPGLIHVNKTNMKARALSSGMDEAKILRNTTRHEKGHGVMRALIWNQLGYTLPHDAHIELISIDELLAMTTTLMESDMDIALYTLIYTAAAELETYKYGRLHLHRPLVELVTDRMRRHTPGVHESDVLDLLYSPFQDMLKEVKKEISFDDVRGIIEKAGAVAEEKLEKWILDHAQEIQAQRAAKELKDAGERVKIIE